jgi:hypothetical protein
LIIGTNVEASLAAWRAFSLALMGYRQGNYADAESWCAKSIAFSNANPCRTVNLQIVLAMTHYRLGQKDLAHSELAQARGKIENQFTHGLEVGAGGEGFWFDWVFARVLLHEAVTLIEEL